MTAAHTHTQVIEDTRRWLERAVVGLNLCPFAKAVQAKEQVHFAVSEGTDFAPVLADLEHEAEALRALPASERDTTLLMVPAGFDDFLLFNELVRAGERLLARKGLEGTLQLASFHPEFVFAGAGKDDVANCSNRSPWPTLHLLREASIDRAVAAFPQSQTIYEANIRTLQRLGPQGWQALGVDRS